ncbi:MFS transporter [Pseudonocardia sp. ICBG1034]|uniref:MFS transporter n=1 Tax=Pseudonocardia sp. ICBG1034 TaxID=2844381 RepID=UPI001CCBC2B6|nr:MFS transporter [Pseudonocardia sp. ICBG1034]
MPDQPPSDSVGRRLVLALCVGATANPVNSTMIAPALTSIGRDLGVGAASTLWLVGAMYLASALGQPVAGRLSDVLGPRRVFLAGTVLVAVSGVVGALGSTLGVLVVARVLVGLGTAAAYPSALTMIRDRAHALGLPEPAGALRTLTSTSLLTLTLGPAVGGVLVEFWGWRATFLVNVLLGLGTLALSLGALPRDHPWGPVEWGRLDLPGTGLFGATLGLLMVFLMGLPRPDWLVLVASIGAGTALVVVESRTPAALLDIRMIARNRPLAATYLRFVLTFTVLYAVLFGYTQWLEQARGLSAAASGTVMLVLSGVGAVLAFFAGTRSVRTPMLLGTAGMLAGGLLLVVVDSAAPLAMLVLVPVVFGLPQGLASVTNQLAVYRQSPTKELGTATGLSRTAQYLGAMLATGLLTVVFGEQATDMGLVGLGAVSAGIAVVLLALTALDRSLRASSAE